MLRKYYVMSKLGSGSFGAVLKGKCKATGKIVAIKFMKNNCTSEYSSIKLLREIQIMRELTKMKDIRNSFFPSLIDIIVPQSTR